MHESSLMAGLLERIEFIARGHSARRVRAVEATIGPWASFTPDHLREHFRLAAAGTLAEGADLRVKVSEDPLSAKRNLLAEEFCVLAAEFRRLPAQFALTFAEFHQHLHAGLHNFCQRVYPALGLVLLLDQLGLLLEDEFHCLLDIHG